MAFSKAITDSVYDARIMIMTCLVGEVVGLEDGALRCQENNSMTVGFVVGANVGILINKTM